MGFVLSQLEVGFEEAKTLALQVKVIDALKEIQNQEGGMEQLSEDKKELLFNSDKILKKNESIPKTLDMYKSIVLDLYKDYRTLNGRRTFPHLDQLKMSLKDFNKEDVLRIIMESKQN